MKSSSKINLPPIPPSIFSKRIPSANNPNELEQENEKEKEKKEKSIKGFSQNQEMSTIPIPKYRPPYKNLSKKIFQNAISEETKTYIDNLKKGACNILVCVRCRPLSSLE